MHEALFSRQITESKIQCTLCPHYCILENNETGNCGVRSNHSGKLTANNYARLTAIHSDPIEKKPLYHFYPGTEILSVGSLGCNLHCNFCQNHHISQIPKNGNVQNFELSVDDLIKRALQIPKNIGIAYTYNEPSIWFEYVLEASIKAKKNGLKNVMVSNGYINPEPANLLFPNIDAFNIDLKAFSGEFYKEQTGATLKPVLETIKTIAQKEKHLEITVLIIPGLNDDPENFRNLLKFIRDETGKDTVLHLSRYFPKYKSSRQPTPNETLKSLFEEANNFINFVYIGNVNIGLGNDTYCPNCNTKLISRNYYQTQLNVNLRGNCKKCDYNLFRHGY